MIQELYDKIVDLQAQAHKEWMNREAIKQSGEYVLLESQIRSLLDTIEGYKALQQEMVDAVPNSTPLLDEAKQELFELMKAEGKESFGNAKLKYSNKSEVNKARLLNDLGGDLDLYITLSNVTQSALKDYAKTSGNKSLLSCIETVSTPVGVEFPF